MPAKEIEMPARIARLPRDRRGYPIPMFVEKPQEKGGEPDFRIMSERHFERCVKHDACWICGEPLGSKVAFVVGPMCCVNLISAEPPSHYECAEYSVQVCPFLSIPSAKRREAGLPDEIKEPGGVMIKRNPGVIAIWVTKKSYKLLRLGNGMLISMGEPIRMEFWTKGRRASLTEIEEAVREGFPTLLDAANKQGVDAVREALRQRRAFDHRLALAASAHPDDYRLLPVQEDAEL